MAASFSAARLEASAHALNAIAEHRSWSSGLPLRLSLSCCRDCPAVGIVAVGPDGLSDRPRRDPRRRAIRLQGRVSRPGRSGQAESDGQRRGLCRRVRPCRNLHRSRGRQGPVGPDPARCHAGQAGQRRGGSQRRYAQSQRRMDGLRDRAAQGQERDPVHRRRHVARPSRRRANPLQGYFGRQKPRQARDRRHAPHGAGGDRGLGLDHHRFGELGQRLCDRPQERRQRDGRLCGPHRKPVRRSQGRDHHQPRQAAARHGHRYRHQYRDRGCHAGRDGRAHPPPRRL